MSETTTLLFHKRFLSNAAQKCHKYYVILALLSGIGAGLGQAPWFWLPLAILSWNIIFWLLCAPICHKHQNQYAAKLLWLFGYGYFLPNTYWIYEALLVDATKFGWLIPFAWIFIPLLLGGFWAIAGWLYSFLSNRLSLSLPWHRLFIITILLSSIEWIRGTAFSGFPWGLPAYILASHENMMQAAFLLGIYPLNALVVGWIMMPATIILSSTYRQKITITVLWLGIIVGCLFYGQYRITNYAGGHYDAYIRLIQPNITQALKWRPEQRQTILDTLLTHTQIQAKQKPDIIIWPEASVPFLLKENSPVNHYIAKHLQPGQWLITGSLTNYDQKWFNSLQIFDYNMKNHNTYHKNHLVPFGEYLPLEPWLEAWGLRKIVPVPGNFSAGSEHIPLSLPQHPKIPFWPLICYEVIFPHLSSPAPQTAKWIINITNDAWFGSSAGPHQHLTQARFRAIETGLSVIRVANTGISAIIDPLGRLQQHIDLQKSGIIDGQIPRPYSVKAD